MDRRNPFVIWGSAGHAMVVADTIRHCNGEIVALFDNNDEAVSSLPGVPLFIGSRGLRDWLEGHSSNSEVSAVLAIGGARGMDRHRIALDLAANGLRLPTLMHPSASVSPSAAYGAGCQVLALSMIAAGARLGDVCIVNNHATVEHECLLGCGVHIAPGATLCGCVSVGDYSMVGAGAVILPRIKIGKHVIVGAGSVVTRDIPDNQIVAGNPAKILRLRNDRN